MIEISEVVARWESSARPLFKGKLIDSDGCKCAQGDILSAFGGLSDDDLLFISQHKADEEVAKLLGISVTHSVLLRIVNDRVDGAPSIVLTNPERILGDQAPRLLAFWKHLDNIGNDFWKAENKKTAARAASDGWNVAWHHATHASWEAAKAAAGDDATKVLLGMVAGDVSRASNEIQGAKYLTSFFFLPMFGFSTPADLDALVAKEEVS